MLDAKQIIIDVKGNNKGFLTAMTGAKGSMKAFATSAAGSMAIATAGITVVIAGVVALAAALKFAVKGAAANDAANIQSTTILEAQGIAWEDVSGKVLNHLDALEQLTGFDDTALQESFNTFVAGGMSVEQALKAVDATVAVAGSGVMEFEAAQKAVNKQFTTGVSRLKEFGIEGENFDDILTQINDTMGDGSQRGATFAGKMDILKQVLGDQLEVLGGHLLPVILSTMDALIWGAKYVLPVVIYAFQMVTLPIKVAITHFKILINVAKAAWEALNGNFDAAKAILSENIEMEKQLAEDVKDIILNRKTETDEIKSTGRALKNNVSTQAEITAETARTASAAAAAKAATEWRGSSSSASARMGALGSSMSASTARMLYGDKIPGSVTIAPTSGIGSIRDAPKVIDTGRAHGDNLYQGFTPSSVTVNVSTGDINNQGDVAELGKQVAAAVSGNRSGI